MGGSDKIRDLCVSHNATTTQRASLQQKLFVLDYIRDRDCSLSAAVKHFIGIKCSFKISVSTVSDWKLKEDKLRSLLVKDETPRRSNNGRPAASNRPNSMLLSRRTITTFKYPLIVEHMEAIIQRYAENNDEVNEPLLIKTWKQVAKLFQDTYGFSDEFIEKGPSKGFIYRFKVRNGLGKRHERKLSEDIYKQKEKLNRVLENEDQYDALMAANAQSQKSDRNDHTNNNINNSDVNDNSEHQTNKQNIYRNGGDAVPPDLDAFFQELAKASSFFQPDDLRFKRSKDLYFQFLHVFQEEVTFHKHIPFLLPAERQESQRPLPPVHADFRHFY